MVSSSLFRPAVSEGLVWGVSAPCTRLGPPARPGQPAETAPPTRRHHGFSASPPVPNVLCILLIDVSDSIFPWNQQQCIVFRCNFRFFNSDLTFFRNYNQGAHDLGLRYPQPKCPPQITYKLNRCYLLLAGQVPQSTHLQKVRLAMSFSLMDKHSLIYGKLLR